VRGGWVYLLANRYRGTIYTGVTADLSRRAWQHKHGKGSAFARRCGATRLVHVEEFETIYDAIAREKAIKKWRRDWKIQLIEQANPEWTDLYEFLAAP
jgi:putative endonuclease